MKALVVTFRLAFATRYDEQAKVHVGLCPLLKLYSQGTTEKEAEDAIPDVLRRMKYAKILSSFERLLIHPQGVALKRLMLYQLQYVKLRFHRGF